MDCTEKHYLEGDLRHPWELARFDFFSGLLQSKNLIYNANKILDIGSGDAWFARKLLEKSNFNKEITCWDKEYKKLLAQPSTHTNIIYSYAQPLETFDLTLMLDVLEHVENDDDFLVKVVQTNVNKNGRLLISVPIKPFLYGSHDKMLKHYRRYTPAKIKQTIAKANLDIILYGSIFTSLFFYRIVEKFIGNIKNNNVVTELKDFNGGKYKVEAIRRFLNIDANINYWASKIRVDFLGLSWWAICKKRQ
jgi:2-polyprenyl-3-methyl-5-hydroxy-6-metoxy-1,4-benzoquinol methylase